MALYNFYISIFVSPANHDEKTKFTKCRGMFSLRFVRKPSKTKMQLDHGSEGEEHSNRAAEIDLEEHFQKHGLSSRGYEKIKNDIDNGDMTADILLEFDDSELISIAKEYNLIPKSTASTSNANINTTINEQKTKEFVYVTTDDQSVLNQIDHLKRDLSKYLQQTTNVKNKNKTVILSTITKLQQFKQSMKKSIDDAIQTLVQQVYILYFCTLIIFLV